ncbi:MAG: hypothetical protein M3N32_06660 [Actinomycetota bacterium]|nr:hypothetical protein [Actinomycetota bacterium]
MEERLTVQERIDAKRRRQEQDSQFHQFQRWQQAQARPVHPYPGQQQTTSQTWTENQQPKQGQSPLQYASSPTYDYGLTNYGKGATIFYIAGWLFQIFWFIAAWWHYKAVKTQPGAPWTKRANFTLYGSIALFAILVMVIVATDPTL